MKLALFGSSPIALEAALRFHIHEAALTWFNAEEGVEPLFQSEGLTWGEATSEMGWKLLQEKGAAAFERGAFSWEKWKSHYYLPLVEILKTEQEVKSYKVVSVTKRFLAPREEIKGKSRFHDLFRVIYELNPEEFINQQKEVDPATYERLSEEFIQSLQSSLEMYEDFDLILDLRHETLPTSIAVSGRALGESRIGKEHVAAGLGVLTYRPASEVREIALIGAGDLAAQALIGLGDWLGDPRMRVFVISEEASPFSAFLESARDEVKAKLNSVFARMEEEFRKEVDEFHRKLREWQELDDFVQVKKPKPAEPIPRLVFFSGHSVTAIDQLIDRRRIFVTLEKPDWREGLRQPENNHLDLKTIGVDDVLVANGLKKLLINEFLRSDERGFLGIVPARPLQKNGWKEDLNALDALEKKVFELFSPAGTH